MNRKLSVRQNGDKDCAAACLLSIIRYYGGNFLIEELNLLIKTDAHGTNAFNLIEGIKKIGFDGYGLRIDFKDIDKYIKYPVIAHTISSNMYHYVVIYEINKKYIKIMDPSIGFKKVKHKDFEKIYLGTLLFINPVKEIPNIEIKDKIIKKIVFNFILNKKYIIKIIILSLVITLLSIVINFYLKVYIDYLYPNFSLKLIVNITLCFLFIILFKCIFDNIRDKILTEIKNIVSCNVTNDAIDHIMHLPYSHIKNKPSGEMISRIDDLENFKELVSTILLNVFVNIFLMLSSLIILILINKTLFYISLIIIFFYVIIVFIYSKIFHDRINDIQVYEGNYKKNLVELFNSYETIKNLNLIESFIYSVRIKFNSLLLKIKKFENIYSNEKFFKTLVSDFGIVIIGAFGIYLSYKKLITIGDVTAFASLMLFFTEPIKELLNLVPNIKYAINSYERINDLLIIEKEDINNMNRKMVDGNIRIENLSYSYNKIKKVFKNVNLNIEQHSKFLVYGKSGSGKSTFVKILLRYISEYEGCIHINDINIKDIDKDVIRNSFTYVSQKEILFADTIKNNILLNRKVTLKQYQEILKICNVDKIIDKKISREQFLLEENGFNLSGGERQKIILARGLLKKSNILVLDEALSEVTLEEEIEIIKKVFKKYEKNTIIYISHKKQLISFFKNKYDFSKKGE